jgi:hypothetical protein
MCCCVTGVVFPDVSKIITAFIFRFKHSKLVLADKGIVIPLNVKNYLFKDTVAHPRSLESSAAPLYEPQIL